MRLLFVADDYPPLQNGGYAQLCRDVAHELRRRGHEVTILAAEPSGPVTMQDSEPVIRGLQIPLRWEGVWPVLAQQVLFLQRRLEHNRRVLDKVVCEIKPDALVFWPDGCLDPTLMATSEAKDQAVIAYYLAGATPQQPSMLRQYWAFPGHSAPVRLIKRVLWARLGRDARLDPKLLMRHVMCVSEHERQRAIQFGLAPEHAVVVHNGIDLADFRFRGLPSVVRHPGEALRVLYASRLVETKGAHTAVEAMGWLRRNQPGVPFCLTLLGEGPEPYIQMLDRRIAEEGLAQQVTRLPWMAREQMPEFMARFDVLVLPTIHPEPLARVVHEAMAIGLNVIATPTGGTPEMVIQDHTGLLFSPGEAAELGACLLRLQEDLALCDRLAQTALAMIQERFTIQGMGARVEECLLAWQAARHSPDEAVRG